MRDVRRVTLLLLDEMISEIEFLRETCENRTLADVRSDRVFRYAIERALITLGEAAKHVPESVRNRFVELPWSEMAGLRDVLTHGYRHVDPALLWRAATASAPAVLASVSEVRSILAREPTSSE